MTWADKWSGEKPGLYDELVKKGMIKPENMEPDVSLFSLYLDAFRDLSSCRLSGMSLGAIPFTAIVEYSRIYDVGDFEEFHYIIRKMDSTVLSLDAEKNKKKEKSGDTSNASSTTNKAHSNKV